MTWAEFAALGDRRYGFVRQKPRPGVISAEEFFARAVVRGPRECWPWTGPYHNDGYGSVYLRSERRGCQTHRVAWAFARGPIPAGMHVLHRCDNRRCVNPDHLYLGTPKDNGRDKAARGRCRRHGDPALDLWSEAVL